MIFEGRFDFWFIFIPTVQFLLSVFHKINVKYGMNKPQMELRPVSHTLLSLPECISKATSGSLPNSSQCPSEEVTFITFKHKEPIYIYIGV